MNQAALFDEQATYCLEAATRHRARLLAVAVKLAGSQEGGMDLFQQTCLDCHDAIQRRGFTGDRYEFYLLTALKNLHYKEVKERARTLPLPEAWEPAALPAAPGGGSYAQLATQVAQEARERFTPAERVALRLHADGYSCQQIADLTGTGENRFKVHRQLERLKAALRGVFQQAFDMLAE